MFNVTEYQVIGDGVTNNTKAIAALIDVVEKAGGGTIYFPAGEYVTGTITLKSNMTLYLDAGAVILGSENREEYPFIDSKKIPGWDGVTKAAIITAFNAQNIAVMGRGKIDGRGYNWWHKSTDGTTRDGRPRTLQFFSCDNIRIDGITIVNSPMWTIHPVCSNNITVHGVTIKNPWDSPNTDGINPESCSNVHISNCHIDVGDDCITIKSGTQNDSYQRLKPCENITVTNCTMVNGHGGVVIGSEMSGGVKNVVISNCVFGGTDRGIRIKTRRKRGGTVEDVRVTNIVMNEVFCPIVINGFYQCGAKPYEVEELFSREKAAFSDDTPTFKNIYISNVTARGCTSAACFMMGIPESPITGVSIDNFVVDMKQGEVKPEQPAMAYGIPEMSKQGMKLLNVKDVTLKNIRVAVFDDNAVTIEDSEDITMDSIIINSSVPGKPVISLKNVSNAYITKGISGAKLDGEFVHEENCSDIAVK